VYDQWLEDPRVAFLDEPADLEQVLRTHSRLKRPAPKDWADAYLLAFALVSGMQLVTLDRAFRGKTSNLILAAPLPVNPRTPPTRAWRGTDRWAAAELRFPAAAGRR
jgi:hypothetical protein